MSEFGARISSEGNRSDIALFLVSVFDSPPLAPAFLFFAAIVFRGPVKDGKALRDTFW